VERRRFKCRTGTWRPFIRRYSLRQLDSPEPLSLGPREDTCMGWVQLGTNHRTKMPEALEPNLKTRYRTPDVEDEDVEKLLEELSAGGAPALVAFVLRRKKVLPQMRTRMTVKYDPKMHQSHHALHSFPTFHTVARWAKLIDGTPRSFCPF